MAGWKNPLPIGQSKRTSAPGREQCLGRMTEKGIAGGALSSRSQLLHHRSVDHPRHISASNPPKHGIGSPTRVLTKYEILKPFYSSRSLLPAHHPLQNEGALIVSQGHIGVHHPVRQGQRSSHQRLPQWNYTTAIRSCLRRNSLILVCSFWSYTVFPLFPWLQ